MAVALPLMKFDTGQLVWDKIHMILYTPNPNQDLDKLCYLGVLC